MRRSTASILAGLLVLAAPWPGRAAEEIPVAPHTRTDLAVTVYQGGVAYVREVREIGLPAGVHRLAFPEVSAALQPETVRLAASGVAVLERRYEAGLLNPAALLRAAVGKRVRVILTNPATGAERTVPAEVLAASNGVVLRIGDRIETEIPGRLVFDALPPGLRPRPTLAATVETTLAGRHQLRLGYLTGGLSWQADYVASLDGDRLALELWATVSNTSGADYPEARLALVAGELNRVAPPAVPMRMAKRSLAAELAPGVVEAPAEDYHRYAIARPVSLGRGGSTQVALMTALAVPVVREYRMESAAAIARRAPVPDQREWPQPVQVRLSFANTAAAGLGVPLPAGIVRVYEGGEDEVFLGESRVPATPDGERVTLTLGRAFDVTARRTLTDFRREGARGEIVETAHRIALQNAKGVAVTVEVVENLQGEWRVLEESQPHKRLSAFKARWRIEVPARGAAELTYRVRLQTR